MNHKLKNGRATSTVRGLLYGLAGNMFITIFAASVIAILIDQEMISWERTGYAVLITVLLASFMGAYISSKCIKRQRLLICSLSGVIYCAGLMLITALFFGGKYEAVAVTIALVMAGSYSAFFLTGPKSKQARHKKRKPITR